MLAPPSLLGVVRDGRFRAENKDEGWRYSSVGRRQARRCAQRDACERGETRERKKEIDFHVDTEGGRVGRYCRYIAMYVFVCLDVCMIRNVFVLR
jgi:hypothetical protein